MTTHECIPRLLNLGIEYEDAIALRRIAMTLHRWNELECGDGNGCIERDETTNKTFWHSSVSDRTWPIADKETGALKRLETIMNKYPSHLHYYQSDPRGASVYILKALDLPENCRLDSYYSRGVAVYK